MKHNQKYIYDLILRFAQTFAQIVFLSQVFRHSLGPLQLKCSKVGHAEKSRKLKDFMLH